MGPCSIGSGNSPFDARPFSVNGLVEPKAAFAQNYFGFTAGGPLFIPKLFNFEKVFWFVNYNGTRLRNGVDQAYTVPTLPERAGNFSGVPGVQLYAPQSGACPALSGNVIPTNCISPLAQQMLQFIPLPNQPGTTRNYRLVASNPSNTESLNTRINTNVTQRDTLALTFNLQERNARSFEPYGCCDATTGQGINTNVNWRHRFGNRSFNNVTLSFNRNTTTSVPFFASSVTSPIAIGGASTASQDFGPPNLSFANFSGLSDSNWTKTAVWNYGASDTLQLHRGKHNWSFGGGATHYLNNAIGDANGRGSFSFSGLATAQYVNGLPVAGTGGDFADFLLGLPETSSISHGITSGVDSVLSAYFRSNLYNAFAMDDWRVASNLTLNLGVRYEYFTPWAEERGHLANLDIAPGFAAVASRTARPNRTFERSRLSLHLDPSRSSRLRAAPRHRVETRRPQQDSDSRGLRDLLHSEPVQQVRIEPRRAGPLYRHGLHHHQQREPADAGERADRGACWKIDHQYLRRGVEL